MHDREARKLRLSVTTVRPLADDELRDVVGGARPITYSILITLCSCAQSPEHEGVVGLDSPLEPNPARAR